MKKADIEALAQLRIEDALILISQKRYSSAYYIAGYCVELALKSCISKLFHQNAIPNKAFVDEIYTHNLKELTKLAGLEIDLNNDARNDPIFGAYWGIVSKWNEHSRYQLWDEYSSTSLVNAIADPSHGVFQWLKKKW